MVLVQMGDAVVHGGCAIIALSLTFSLVLSFSKAANQI